MAILGVSRSTPLCSYRQLPLNYTFASMLELVLRRTPRLMRALLGIPALLLGLALLVPAVHAQADVHLDHSAADHAESGMFVLKAGPNGDLVCEHANETEVAALRRTTGAPLNFTVFSSTNDEQDITGMRILLRATDQLLEFPDALLAFRRAAARWERAFSTPITTVIDVDFGPERFNSGPFGPNVLASATNGGRTFSGVGPAEIVEALIEQNGDDPQLRALYEAIPIPTPSTSGSNLQNAVVARPLAQAYGYLPAEADPDPIRNPFGEFATIGFNSAFQWDFNPADGVPGGVFDFEAVAVHEMGHSLGFTSIIGSGGPPNNFFSILDFFRVRPEAVTPGEPLDDGAGWEVAERVVTPGPPSPNVVQVFFDGLEELPLSTATGGRQGGDGQQASHWRDDALGTPFIGIMDPNFASGTVGQYTENDLRAFEVIGYRVEFNIPLATASFAVNGESIDTTAPDSLTFVDIGDAASGGTTDLAFEITNTSDVVALDYSVEVDIDVAYPADAEPVLTLSPTGGTIAPGDAGTVTLSAGGNEQSVFYGIFRVETNVENALVVEVPFRFSVDGGEAPQLVLSVEDAGAIGDVDGAGSETLSLFTISNGGNIDLDYQATTTLVGNADPFPFDTDLVRTGGDVLFTEDFGDGDLGDFTAGGSFPGDWQVVDIGPALLDGHSAPNTAYFGQVTNGVLQYRNLATGLLVSPALDLSGVSPENLVVLSFNTYLQSELTGQGCPCDIASVLISLDDGATYQEVATSDNGILENTTEWENVRIELPLLAGAAEPVRFAFQFTSDPFVTDVGWFVDDVTLTTEPNPVFVSPATGVLGEDGSQELSLTVQGDQFERGFYRGAVTLVTNGLSFSGAGIPVGFTVDGDRVLQTIRSVPFTLTVGDPSPPILTPAAPPAVSVPSDNSEIVEFDATNTGGSGVTYLRLLEPALSSFEDADGGLKSRPSDFADLNAPSPVESAASVAGGDSLFSITLTGVILGIAQSTSGDVVVVETLNGGQTSVLTPDLSEVRATLDGFVESGDRAVGLAFNDKTATYWFALASNQLVEATLGASAVEPTGRVVDLDFIPAGIAYSPELDAFFVTERSSSLIYAVDESGTALPGYPIESPGRGGFFPDLSVTNGVIEVLNDDLSYVQVDQFARLYEESEEVEVPGSLVGGASRINGLLRSKIDPNGVLYYFTTPSGGEVRVVGVDPSDLPAYTQTLIEAAEPLFGLDLEPGATTTVSLRIDPDGREPGTYTDALYFLTNNPEGRLVSIPLSIDVTPATDSEGGVIPTEFAVHQNYPNPFRARTTMRFDLPAPSRTTLHVYNVLGQRVATLLDNEEMEAGEHAVPLDARHLASGTYVVRLMAGSFVGTSRITVIK